MRPRRCITARWIKRTFALPDSAPGQLPLVLLNDTDQEAHTTEEAGLDDDACLPRAVRAAVTGARKLGRPYSFRWERECLDSLVHRGAMIGRPSQSRVIWDDRLRQRDERL